MDRALYQKYRPSNFSEILDQPQVVSVLEKAAELGSAAHAYLFMGPRGIGKTSVARVFATALGCDSIDLFEVDAASHTSVENIREISASVRAQPVASDRKVYILDEVHMLSKSAFNAFLKTLEEPPPRVVFILVTTEPDKLPETVVSRCLSLQFRQPSISALRNAALSIAEKEKYTLPEQSADLISLMAGGSFRDMLTLLQKVFFVASDDKSVSHETAEMALGAPKHSFVNEYLTALTGGSVSDGIAALGRVSDAESDMSLFAQMCIRKIRVALLVRAKVDGSADEYPDDEKAFIESLAKQSAVTPKLLRSLIEASRIIPSSNIKALPLECLLLSTDEK